MTELMRSIFKSVDQRKNEAISFLQELIRNPSLSGKEADVALALSEKMHEIGFDAVIIDDLKNVMGTIAGSKRDYSILMNGHLDHVPPGDMVDPYSGKCIEGTSFGVEGKVIYGRGASDMKSSLAAMVMSGAILRDLDLTLNGDVKIAAVAQEELGGAGTISTIQDSHFTGNLVVIGEATDLNIALGHRGSMKMGVVVKGVSCHASDPDRGTNAIYKAIDLISRIKNDLIPKLPEHSIFGKTTLAVTQIKVKPDVGNVVPEECWFGIDCRNSPNFPAKSLKDALEEVLTSAKNDDPELEAFIIPSPLLKGQIGFNGFYTDPRLYPIVHDAKDAISEALERQIMTTTWKFATDGRFYSWLGIPVIGFGPGDERFAHTHQDHVRIIDFIDSIKAYTWLACKICGIK